MGDEAILVSELLFLRAQIKDVEFYILSFDPDKTGKVTAGIPEVKRILWMGSKSDVVRSDFSGILKSFKEADLVVIGGGGIFQDLYNHYPIPFFTAMAFLSRLYGKRLVLYCVGIGPVRTFWGKKLCRYAANAADFISVRDAESKVLLQEFGVSKEVHLSADPVFLLKPVFNEKTEKVIQKLRRHDNGPVIGVCVQELLPWNASNKKVLADVLDTLVREVGAHIVFLPMGVYKDRLLGRGKQDDPVDVATSKKLAAMMEGHSSMILEELNPQEMLGVMQSMNLLISMRLHGLIMGLTAGVPVVGLTYSDESKIRNLMRRLGQEERLFDVRNLEKQGLLTLIGDLLSGKQETRDNLSEAMAALLSQIKRCNDQFIERLTRDASRERAQRNRSPVRREDAKSENRYV